MTFLRNFFASLLGSLVAVAILFIIALFFLVLAGNVGEEKIIVAPNSVLTIGIKKPIKDYEYIDKQDPFGNLFIKNIGVNQILKAINKAKTDPKIKGISIQNNFSTGGMALTKAIRDALMDFKSSGKFVLAYGDFFTQTNYYLASVATSVYMHPMGYLDFRGLAAQLLYFKDLQEKTGIKMEVIRHGKYKSAVEPFLNNKMSKENREQISTLIGAIWDNMLTEIGKDRGLTVKKLNTLADELGARTSELALHSKLVDDLLFQDQYEEVILKKLGTKEIKEVRLLDYIKKVAPNGNIRGKEKIAVIYAQGEIRYQATDDKNYITPKMINKALKKARENQNIKAVVLRINSPGGDALSSDIIWREIEKTKKIKPIVVSMGNVAASGGYYIASGANKIFAESSTVTGSIGVFAVVPNLYDLSRKIGINEEQVGTNKHAVFYSPFKPADSTFVHTTKENIEVIYKTFLKRVAEGRKMDVAAVDEIAQGRIWSGVEAKEKGLVDELGGIEDAIATAAELAGISNFGIREFPRSDFNLEKLFEEFTGDGNLFRAKIEDYLKKSLGEEIYPYFLRIKKQPQKGVQARIPFELVIQ